MEIVTVTMSMFLDSFDFFSNFFSFNMPNGEGIRIPIKELWDLFEGIKTR